MRNIVFDIESRKTVDEVYGWANKHRMGIAVLCAIDFDTGEEMVFSDEYEGALPLRDVHGVFAENNLIGFNIKSFDIRLLQEEFHKWNQDIEVPFGVFDISDGKRISLGSLSKETLGTAKLMNGADAPLEWRKGGLARDAVVKYCMDDVIKTKNLLDYGINNGIVFYTDSKGNRKEWRVDWAERLRLVKSRILYPECLGRYRVAKKIWQCARCAFKRKCSSITIGGDKYVI